MPLSYAQELQKKKEEEERQKAEQKVVGQQQKTQPEASKPTGSTSIPTREANKETARTDNSSSRSTSRVGDTEAKRQARADREKGSVDRDVTNRRQETDTHTRRTEFRDTKQINEDKRKEKRLNLPGYSNSQYAKNSNYSRIEPKNERRTESQNVPGSQYYGGNGQTIGGGTVQRIPSPEDFPDAMGSSVQQVNNLQQYINSTPKDFSGATIGSAQTAKEELEKILYGDRQAKTADAVRDSNPFASLLAGAGNGVLSTVGDISTVVNNALGKLAPSTEGMTPDEIYNSAMENFSKGWLRDPTKDQKLYSDYKNYIQQQMESGDITPEELQKMQNLEAAYSKIGSHYLEELGKDAEAINAGYQQQNPIANAAGQMVPMILGNVALSGLGVGSGAAAAAEKISNPMLRFAAKQGANLIPDLIVDTAPEMLANIADNKSKEEIAKDALVNIGLNAGANMLFDFGPQGLKAIADKFNGSNTAKQTVNNVIPEIAEQATKNVVPDAGEQAVKNSNVVEQAIEDITNPYSNIADEIVQPGAANNVQNIIPEISNVGSSTAVDVTKIRNNGFLNILRDSEYGKLADFGGQEGNDALGEIIRAIDSGDSAAYDAAISEYKRVLDTNGGQNADRILSRLDNYVKNAEAVEKAVGDIDTDVLNSITGNIDTIDAELRKLDAIGVPPTKNGTDWLANAHQALDEYENAVFTGGDIRSATDNLNRALGNLDGQAKKLDNYDGAFSQWRGGGTARGDLYTNSSQMPGFNKTEWTDDMIDELNDYSNQNRFARPVNQAVNNASVPRAEEFGLQFTPGDYKDAIKSKQISRQDVIAKTTPEFQDVLRRLSNNENVTREELMNLPEVKYAEARMRKGDSWAEFEANPTAERKAMQQQLADDYYSRGSATIDENGKVAYNGDVERGKKVFFVTGLPASGKSSTLVDRISQNFHARVLDSDDIKYAHKDFDNGFGGNYIHNECKEILGNVTDEAIKNGDNMVIPIIGGDDPTKLAKKIKAFQDKGWEVSLCQNDLPSNKALGRAMSRYITDGRYIPPKILMDYADTPHRNYLEMVERGSDYGLKELSGFARVDNDVAEGSKAITKEYGGSLSELFGGGDAGNTGRYGGLVPEERSGNGAGLHSHLTEGTEQGKHLMNEGAFSNAENKIPDADDLSNASAPENFLDEFAKTHPEDVAEDTAKAANNATTNDTAISQARTNVFERSGINAEESKNIYKAEDYSYVKDSNPAQMERAAENLNRLGDDAVKHYTSNDFDPKKASVEDVDSMMMLTERLRNEARATSDVVEKSKLYAQSRDLSIKSVQAASEFGRDLQSWSKWADTPERVVDKGYGVLLNKTDDFLKSNPRVKWGIEDISDGIEKLFKEKDVAKVMESGDAEAIAKLKREISNGIDDLIKNADKGTQKALKGLSEKEIDQLMYENSTKSISQALEMFAGTGSMGLKDSTVDEIFDLMAKNESLNPNSKAFVQNEKKIYSMIANDLTKGGTFGQKVDTWRYLSMLTNPSTHLRNLTGNITMQGVAGVKNDLAAIIESAADRVSKSGIDRTKGIVNPFTDSDLLAATKKDAIDNAYRQLSGNRYTGISQGIESEVKAFKDKGVGKAINKISDVNSGALSAEDEFFKVNEYSTALAGYLKGNGFDASILGDELSEENAKQLKKIFGKGQRARAGIDSVEGMKDQFLQDARAYAVNKANVQTFNNSNEIANKFSNFSRGLRESDSKGAKALGYALDVTIPFKNVPANVLNTAIAYSPAEWAKVLADTNKLMKGSMNAADFIDEVATATTGTVGMALGAYLAHEGIVRMGSEKGTREKNFDKATDKLNGAISINGKSVDMTQLMPSAAPLIYGAMVYDVMANKDNGLSALDTITSGLAAVADGVTDMTMLSGLSDILEAGKYADDKNSIWGTIGAKVASNALSQMVPTVGGKIEKIFDDTQRNSWYSDKAGLAKDAETAAKYNSTKIIGAQALGENLKDSDNKVLSTIGDLTGLEPRINSKGEEMKNKGGNALGRAVNAVLPLELGSDNSTETDNKLRELAYKFPAGDERDAIFPYAKQSEAKFNNADGEQVQLTPEQWTEYQKSKGQMTNEMIDKFLNSDSYEQMEDVDRAETLKKMYDFATKYNQHVIGDGKLSKDMQELADIYESDGVDGVLSQMMGKAIAESAGVRGNSNAAKAIQEDIANGNMDAANEKAEAYGSLSDYGLTNKSAINVYNYAAENNSDVNIEEFAETYKKLDSNENGSITQKELLEYANSGDHTQEEIDQLWDTYLAGSYTKVPVLEDGEWKSKKPSSETVNNSKTTEDYSGGSVDIHNRPKVPTSELKAAGWDNAGDGYATVFSSTYSNENETDCRNFTPIVVENGKYVRTLSPDELQTYAEGVISGKPDDLGLQIGGSYKSVNAAVKAADNLHEEQAVEYANKPMGNATKGLSKRQQVAQQHSWTNNQSAKTENSIPDATDLPDASTDIAPKSTVRSYVDQNGNTQTYDMATTKWYQNGISAGYSSDDVIRMHDEANYDGQGKVTKDEAKQYINSNYANASAEEKRRLFSFICTSKAKNPY